MADERNKANRSEGLKGSPDRRKAHKDELERLDRDIKRAHDEADPFYQTPEAENLRAARRKMQTAIEDMKQERARIYSDQMKLGNPLVKEHVKAVREIKDFYEGLIRDGDEYEELTSYILDELEKPEWDDYRFLDFTLQELLDAAEQDTERTGPAIIVERARQAQAADREKRSGELARIKYAKSSGIKLTTDKLSTVFFDALRESKGQVDGQMSFSTWPVKYEGSNSKEITLFYNFSFDEDTLKKFGLEKIINDEDYFILSLIDNFQKSGNTKSSVTKLYKELTGANPNKKQLTDLTKKLIKMAATTTYINDKEVSQAWGLNTYREIIFPLAPIKIGTERFLAGGQVVNAAFEITGEVEIMKLGLAINQYTTIPKALLYVTKNGGPGKKERKVSRTPRFYKVLHYLIRRIAAMKSGKLSNKILYSTFYNELGEKSPRSQQLARDLMYVILEHFKRCEWITGYKEDDTPTTASVGVKIFFDTPKKQLAKKALSRSKAR